MGLWGLNIFCPQVNGGTLPPHVIPFCAVAAVLAAILPVAAFFISRASAQMQECQPIMQAKVRVTLAMLHRALD